MILVLIPNHGEFNNDKDNKRIVKLADENALRTWLYSYSGRIELLQIFEANALKLTFSVEKQ